MIHFNYYRCEKCNFVYDFHFFGLTTLVGPEYIKCRKCQEINKTIRLEWKQFDTKTKIKSALISLFYLGAVGYTFGYYMFDISQIVNGRPSIKMFEVPWEIFSYYFGYGVSIVMLLLWLKIRNSNQRFETNPDLPSEKGLFTLDLTFGAQVKIMFFVVFLYGIAFALKKI